MVDTNILLNAATPDKMPLDLITHGPEETEAAARWVQGMLRPGAVVALFGDLGAGKTCFVRGIARLLNVRDAVLSPTYTLIHEYRGDLPLYHVDLYRIDSIDAVLDLGLEELFDGEGVTVIEWAERAEEIFPERTLFVRIEESARTEDRRIRMEWKTPS